MGATFKLDATGSGAVKAVTDLQNALKAAENDAEGLAGSTKKAEAEAKRLAAQADPTERYAQKMARLADAVKRGGLGMEQAELLARRYGEQLDRAGQSGERAFGDRVVSQIASVATGWLSVGAAVGSVTKLLSEIEQKSQEAADALLSSLGTAGELQQLGPESFARGAATARRLQALGVTSSLSQAFAIATNLENSGATSAEDQNLLIEKLAGGRVVSAENLPNLATSLKKFQSAFAGQAGDLSQVVDKSIFVSTIPGVSTGLTDTVTQTLKFADFFKQFGVDQTLGAFAGVESISPNAENAAEALKSFGAQIKKRGLVSGDLFGTLENIDAKIAGGKTAFEVLGEQNAVIGYDRLRQQREKIRAYAGQIGAAGGTLDRTIGLLDTDPELAAANLRARAEAEYKSQIQNTGATGKNLLAALTAESQSRSGFGAKSTLEGFAGSLDSFFGLEDVTLREARAEELKRRGAGESPRLSDDLLKQIEGHLRSIDEKQSSKITTRAE